MVMNDLNPYKEDHLKASPLETQVGMRPQPILQSDSSAASPNSSIKSTPTQQGNLQQNYPRQQSTLSSNSTMDAGSDSDFQSYSNSNSSVVSKGVDPRKVKMFLVMLAKACKRHEIRLQAHQEFHDHLHKIKSAITTKDYPQVNLNQDLDELKKKVSHLISVEKNPSTANKVYQDRIAMLESKLNKLMQSKLERDKRFEQLEARINTKLDADKQLINELEKKLLILQKKLLEKRMNTRSPKNKQGIDVLRKQIQKTQDALDDIKGRQSKIRDETNSIL